MSLEQAGNSFDLLGQAMRATDSVRLPTGDGPKLEIGWGSFHQGIGSSIAAILRRSGVPRSLPIPGFFKDAWIERRMPRRAVLAAALWHLVFLIMPSPQLPAAPRHFSAFDNTELTWSGPINDLPLLRMEGPKPKRILHNEPEKLLPQKGADAFHPRQRIFTNPVRPTHPRQTVINSAAPMEPPKILPNLPNIVQFQRLPGPTRPRMQISQETLAKLRPHEIRRVKMTSAAAPDLPALDQKLADIAPAMLSNAPARPKLELNAGAAPRAAPRAQAGNTDAAPDVGTGLSSTTGNPATFIALSATPGPPAPVVPPQGNLAARISVSPEGKQPGVPGGAANGTSTGGPSGQGSSGAGKGPMDISISGGNPSSKNTASGLGYGSAPRALITRPTPYAKTDELPDRTGPPNFTALPPGAQPERVFASKRVYKLLINMPNLNSATGSWILNFTELRTDTNGPHVASSDVSGPTPIRKVDPKYPPTLILDHIEGEVVLYAVIRRDGSVDSIQLVRGIDEQLDANAMNALSQWKFKPASRQGEPVELEAIVHIPFHAPSDR